MSLEVVWKALSKRKWMSSGTLKQLTGLNDETLSQVIGFLVGWDFAEERNSQELFVRRKDRRLSPLIANTLLRSLTPNNDAALNQARLD